MSRDPPTRYPFPPQDSYRHFPDVAPWDEPISQLAAFSVLAQCESCGKVKYPLRLMAAEVGWKRTLRTIAQAQVQEVRIEASQDCPGAAQR